MDAPPRDRNSNKIPGSDWFLDQHGYAARYVGGKKTLQHREVMKETLGRDLRKGENVHHINGVKTDNRPENLELWVTSQPAGQRPSDLLAWAYEIIDRYGKETASKAVS